MHKKMQVRALWSHTAKALTQWNWSCGICSWRGPIFLVSELGGLRRQLLEQLMTWNGVITVTRGASGAPQTRHASSPSRVSGPASALTT